MASTAVNTDAISLSKGYLAYQAFKYAVYCLLAYNIFLFFMDDYAASAHTFRNGIALTEIVEAFSATVDTAAWVLLLLLFELETFVISDEKLNGLTKWSLHGVRALCYLLIIYAWYGYIVKLQLMLNASPAEIVDTCSLIGTNFTYIQTLDEYQPIDANICQALNAGSLFQINGTEIITTEASLAETQRLAWVDVINATDWLLIVAILEIDVYLQLKGKLTGNARKLSQIIKSVLYFTLFINAIYWGIKGDFLDFWDAFLWLVAFIFIEMNIFEWHKETGEQAGACS